MAACVSVGMWVYVCVLYVSQNILNFDAAGDDGDDDDDDDDGSVVKKK